MSLPFLSLPDVVQFNIIEYLNLQDFCALSSTCQYCYEFCEQKHVWHAHFQNHFPWSEYLGLKCGDDSKSVFKRHYDSCTGVYYNTGLNSSGECYTFPYLLFQGDRTCFGTAITGKTTSFEVIGLKFGTTIIYFQYKPQQTDRVYWAVVFGKNEEPFLHCRWITNFNTGVAISERVKRHGGMSDLYIGELEPQNKKLLDEFPDACQDVTMKPGRYEFYRVKNGVKLEKSLIMTLKFIFHARIGWCFENTNDRTKLLVSGICTRNYCAFVVDRRGFDFVCLDFAILVMQNDKMEGLVSSYKKSGVRTWKNAAMIYLGK